jgi:hypothetical protein
VIVAAIGRLGGSSTSSASQAGCGRAHRNLLIVGGGDAALVREAVTDPEQTVRLDVELLRSATVLPNTITVSGHVYDVTTGLVTTIIPATGRSRPHRRHRKRPWNKWW